MWWTKGREGMNEMIFICAHLIKIHFQLDWACLLSFPPFAFFHTPKKFFKELENSFFVRKKKVKWFARK